MINRLLGIDPNSIVKIEDFHFQHVSMLLVAILILAAIAYAAIPYWREGTLSVRRRLPLAALRLLALAVLVAVILQPVLDISVITDLKRNILVLVDTSASMAIRDARKDPEHLAEAAMALGKLPLGPTEGAALTDRLKAEVSSASRIELATAILNHPDMEILRGSGPDYKVRHLGFSTALTALDASSEESARLVSEPAALGSATQLGSAIQDAVDRYSGQPIAGVVVLTDGASNAGVDPLEVAGRMRERGVPIYPVGIGLPAGDDVRLQGLVVQEVAFAGDMVPVRAHIISSGFENRAAELTAMIDGIEVVRKTIILTGRQQFEELSFQASRTRGTRNLEVAVSPLPGEARTDNNRLQQTIRIVDDKIKVLYIEGSPRWEYRYLRAILKRDPRLDVMFINTEGDRDLARASKEYIARFPEDRDEAFKWDLVILGDVRRDVFNSLQLDLMAELVREHGSSFIMLAGHKHSPSEYAETPVGAMLPVVAEEGKWQDVPDDVFPELTPEGLQSMVMLLDPSETENQKVWAKVKPLVSAAPLVGAKSGARTLAQLSNSTERGQSYPLIAWHRYGSGKVLYVGTDRLWQLRARTGDKYHSRFWGQAVQFLTLSRLLGDNKRVRLDADRTIVGAGEPVQLYANVLNEAYEPAIGPAYRVEVQRVKADGDTDGNPDTVQLQPLSGMPGLYHGLYMPRTEGHYQVHPVGDDRNAANGLELESVSQTTEQLETRMQEGLLRKMALMSGGQYLSISELPKLAGALHGETRTATVHKQVQLWDAWLVPILFLGLVAIEWAWRRKNDLA